MKEQEGKGIRQHSIDESRRKRRVENNNKVKKSTCFNFIHLQSHFWYQKVLFLLSAFLRMHLVLFNMIFYDFWTVMRLFYFTFYYNRTSQTSQVSADSVDRHSCTFNLRLFYIALIFIFLFWFRNFIQPSFHLYRLVFVCCLWMRRMKRCTSIDSFRLINNVYLVIAWMH